MGIINKDRFVEVAQTTGVQELLMFHHPGRRWDGYSYRYIAPLIDRETALRIFDNLKETVLSTGSWQNKNLRPWTLDPSIIDALDQTQPWWGFEFETGYQSQEALREVMEHVWDTWDNVCFDTEGDGRWISEITFAPETLSVYEQGESKAQQFIKYIASVPELTYSSGAAFVGTHFNLSLPELRSSGFSRILEVCNVLNNTLHHAAVNGAPFDKYFGRSMLYGGFFAQESWVEGKLFRTTYNEEVFKEYLRVAKVLTHIAQEAVKHPDLGARGLHAANAVQLLDGDTTDLEWDVDDRYWGYGDGDFVSGDACYPDNDYGDTYEDDDSCDCDWCASERADCSF